MGFSGPARTSRDECDNAKEYTSKFKFHFRRTNEAAVLFRPLSLCLTSDVYEVDQPRNRERAVGESLNISGPSFTLVANSLAI
jgi:hypothetical protein